MKLDDAQQKAVTHNGKSALVLAGPGSGKTTTILARVKHLLQNGSSPSRILVLTFNKKAAMELKERFESEGVEFSTIHSFCYRRIIGGLGNGLRVLSDGGDDISQRDLIKLCFKEVTGKDASNEIIDSLSSDISLHKNKMGLAKAKSRGFDKIYQAYEAYKSKHNLIDFDDMLILSNDRLNETSLRAKLVNHYQHIMVDEAQDTSTIQWQIIKKISRDDNLFLVGDDDQCIYGFRGSDPGHIVGIDKYFSNVTRYHLNSNYRSTQRIVELSKRFISSNHNRYSKELISKGSEGDRIEVLNFTSDMDQLAFIQKEIKANPQSKIGVLFRNNLSIVPYGVCLATTGLDFGLSMSSFDLVNSGIYRDVAWIVEFIRNRDYKSFKEIYYKLGLYIKKEHLSAKPKDSNPLLSISKSLSPWEGNRLIEANKDMDRVARANGEKIMEYIAYGLDYVGYIDRWSEFAKVSSSYHKEIFRALYLIGSMAMDIDGLVDLLRASKSLKGKPLSNLELSTIHQAKGKEYDIVFLPDLVEGIMPSFAMSEAEEEDIEEERRIMYVGITRARHRLVFCSFNRGIGHRTYIKSSFIGEILGKESSDFSGLRGKVLHHKNFGQGSVIDCEGNKCQIKFKVGIKLLDMEHCIKQGIISI